MKGLIIKDILRKNGFTVSGVAEKLGESNQNLFALLGKDDVRTSLVERISAVTGIPISVFYGETPTTASAANHSSAVAGNNNRVNNVHTTTKCEDFHSELAAQQAMTKQALDQVDKLLDILQKQATK